MRFLAWGALAAGIVWVYAHREAFPRAAKSGRIVSVVPSATELVYEVGAGDRLAGVTTWCRWPPEAQSKEKIGDVTPNYERILALAPSFVVSSEELVPQTNAMLRRLGLDVVTVDATTFEGIAESLRTLGGRLGADGETPARRLMERVRAVERRIAGTSKPTVYFEVSGEPILSTGPATYVGHVIDRAGGRNIFETGDWIMDASWEEVLRRDPDVLVFAHPAPAHRPGWATLRGRVVVVEGDKYLVPTSRLADALEELAGILHEDR